MSKKVTVVIQDMVDAAKKNKAEPWAELGMSRGTFFRNLQRLRISLVTLRHLATVTEPTTIELVGGGHAVFTPLNSATETKTETKTKTETETKTETKAEVTPATTMVVPKVRAKFHDEDTYRRVLLPRWKERDLKKAMEVIGFNPGAKAPERTVLPPMPEELKQYDYTDVPYEVWTKYGADWGKFYKLYGSRMPQKNKPEVAETERRPWQTDEFLAHVEEVRKSGQLF